MSQKNNKTKNTKMTLSRLVTALVLLVLVVIGLVSTTFSSFVTGNENSQEGSLVAQIMSSVVNRSKEDIAQTGASRTIAAGEYIYIENFKPSGWGDPWITSDGKAYLYIWNSGSDGSWYPFELYSGTAGAEGAIYRAKVTTGGTYSHFISTRGNSSYTGGWYGSTGFWNQTGDLELSSSSNCYYGFTANGTSRDSKVYAVPPSSVTASVTNAVSGSGTNADPYIVRPGASFTIELTATKADPGMEGFGWNINSSSSKASSGTSATYTESYTASTTEGTSTYTGYAWCYEGSTANYSSAYKTSNTIYVKIEAEKYTYTVTAGTGGKVSPTSGSVIAGNGVSITATPNTGYTFAGWTGLSKATLGSISTATTTLTPTANGATVKANFRPNAPSALTLTGLPVASGTTGDGTQSNPYIVFENSGFTLTANATVVSGATPHYSATSGGTYNTTNTFTPSITTKGTPLSYTVYCKAYANGYYSTDYISATAHYLVFSHLDGENTSFDLLPDTITDADTLTLSGAKIEGVVEAEKAYITHTYQVSTNNTSFSDLSDTTWNPDTTGTYYFRVKTTNIKTGETVYSESQSVVVIQSTIYYTINVTKATVSGNGTATLKSEGTTITDNQILSNKPLTLALARANATPSNYYFTYIKVTDGTTTWEKTNINGNLADTVVIEHVKGDVTIEYCTAVKPLVQPKLPANASSISFKYVSDGVTKTSTTAGNYYVDYNSDISYSVTPNTGFYVSDMKGVEIGTITSSTVEGTKSGIKQNVGEVTATLTENSTFKVIIDTTSDVTTGGSMTIDGTAVSFGVEKPLNYNAQAEVVITPPDGCYAVVSGDVTNATIDTEGKATFNVTLTNKNKECTVKFVSNPKIYMVQPQYGSVYVTSGSGDNVVYYFNGDSVGYGTELTVHAKADHANAKLNSVIVNNASIGTDDGSKFFIYEDSTATADITVASDFAFALGTEYGTRRIFYTDTFNWGKDKVYVHPSNVNGDTNITSGSIKMTQKYYNEYNQYVYYADIPFSAKYVTFYNSDNTSQKTTQGEITNDNNAYYAGNAAGYPGQLYTWNLNYSDYVATDRVDTIQQGTTVKGDAVTFTYTCDYGDDTLSAEVVDGNAATVDFDRGVLSITPTENTSAFTLVKVSSTASTTVKYYLVRVENFEIVDFFGLQKIYSTSVFNNIQLDLIVKGGVLDYAAMLFVSDSNMSGTHNELVTDDTVVFTNSGFGYSDSLQAYINRFTISYQINTMNGVKYYKVEASDAANHKATSTMKTLFGTNTYEGTRCVYFYNNTSMNLSKHVVRACFNDASNTNHRFVTMQKVGNTDYYRAVVPNGYESSVNFYLANPKTFSNNFADYDGTDDSIETYTYGILNESIPQTDDANIVYAVSDFGENGIVGEFTLFDY